MSVNEKIKELRLKKSWSQTDLASRMKMKNSNLSRYEAGKIIPSINVLERFAQVFGVSIDYLLSENNKIEEPTFVKVDDVDLYNRFKQLEKLPEDDKSTLSKVIDSFIIKNKIKNISEVI